MIPECAGDAKTWNGRCRLGEKREETRVEISVCCMYSQVYSAFLFRRFLSQNFTVKTELKAAYKMHWVQSTASNYQVKSEKRAQAG